MRRLQNVKCKMQNVNGIMCPSVQCSGPVLFPQESNFIAYIFKNVAKLPFVAIYISIYICRQKYKELIWLEIKVCLVFLRDSETLPRMPVGLCCTAGKMIFFCT